MSKQPKRNLYWILGTAIILTWGLLLGVASGFGPVQGMLGASALAGLLVLIGKMGSL